MFLTTSPPFITNPTFSSTLDVGERVARDGDQVGELAGLDRADPVLPAEQLGGVGGRGLDRLHRRHALLHHVGELLRVVAVREDAAVGAERHAGARP